MAAARACSLLSLLFLLLAVLSGDYQIVGDTIYPLEIKARDGQFHQVVNRTRKLMFFKPTDVTSAAPSSRNRLLGVWQPIPDVTARKELEIAKFAVVEHNKAAGSSLVFVSILSGEYQIVQGVNYRLLIKANDGHVYQAAVFDQPWIKTRKLVYFKAIGVTRAAPKAALPPPPKPLPGGWQPVPDVTVLKERDIAMFAVTEHNKAAGSDLTLVAVLSGVYQIVNGMNYQFVIMANDGHIYQAAVFDQPWTNTRKLVSFKVIGVTGPAPKAALPPPPKPLPGLWQPIPNVTVPKVLDMAKFAVMEHNKAAGSSLTLVAVLSGKYHIVAGKNYMLLIKASDGHVYRAVIAFDQQGAKIPKLTYFSLKN